MSSPSVLHAKEANHLSRYLLGARRMPLVYRTQSEQEILTVECDADHGGGNPCSGQSTSGWCLRLGAYYLAWGTSTQSTIATSSAESEFYSAVRGVKDS
eukprot:2841356-Amphidinium_carterae.4